MKVIGVFENGAKTIFLAKYDELVNKMEGKLIILPMDNVSKY